MLWENTYFFLQLGSQIIIIGSFSLAMWYKECCRYVVCVLYAFQKLILEQILVNAFKNLAFSLHGWKYSKSILSEVLVEDAI